MHTQLKSGLSSMLFGCLVAGRFPPVRHKNSTILDRWTILNGPFLL